MSSPKRLFSNETPSREFLIVLAILAAFLTLWFSFATLRQALKGTHPSGIHLSAALFLFALPILMGWASYHEKGAVAFVALGSLTAAFVSLASGTFSFIGFIALYGTLFFLLRQSSLGFQNALIQSQLAIEKDQETRNELASDLKKTTEEIDAALGKYERHYGFREVAERLARSLSLGKLAGLIVSELKHFIPKGEAYLIYVADVEQSSLSLVGSVVLREEIRVKAKKGDLFDLWVLKNRQRLLVTDVSKDFRFDPSKLEGNGKIRSLILAPLIDEGRMMGTLRVHSSEPEAFGTEDLRLLDTMATLASSAMANAVLFQKTEELAIRDGLTGLFVQRYFKERLSEEHGRALLSKSPLSVLMGDLDHFKNYNDCFGHGAGDLILTRVGELMRETIGELGIVSRYGGEEFAVILPKVSKAQAREIAESIRSRVEASRIEIRREPTQITISLGLASFPDDTLERDALIQKADQRLYLAKRGGRNRVSAD